MARYALIESATGRVANVIDLEGGVNWECPEGHVTVRSDDAAPGWQYDNATGEFSNPEAAAD